MSAKSAKADQALNMLCGRQAKRLFRARLCLQEERAIIDGCSHKPPQDMDYVWLDPVATHLQRAERSLEKAYEALEEVRSELHRRNHPHNKYRD